MKKYIPAIAALCCILISMNSNAQGKNSLETPKNDMATVTDASPTCFVQLNDGTIKSYTSLKLVTGVLKTPHLLADNKEVINAKEIMAYQTEKNYAVSTKLLTSTKDCRVAVNALPGFAVKILSGKLNVYSRKYYNGGNTVEEYFLQNGNEGFIVAYSKVVLISMLKEDAKAVEYFNSDAKLSPKAKKMLTTVEMYNSGQFVTKN